ncbi:hypothetical protein AERO8C_80104 [Aeromonas veronii]|uniref:Uncharacterized protein n=1 Tax=Aeromonas veronii TaxID=654 RepID=A0A653LC77_AERVE|nr:hypothetical protein AERO8C_80104 [Aeromonas veronii]
MCDIYVFLRINFWLLKIDSVY